jgi:hypothetical protein
MNSSLFDVVVPCAVNSSLPTPCFHKKIPITFTLAMLFGLMFQMLTSTAFADSYTGAFASGEFIVGDGSGGGGGGGGGDNATDGGAGGSAAGALSDSDTLTGYIGDDVIFGDGSGGGNGVKSGAGASLGGAGGGGNDVISGGAGHDIIFGDGFGGETLNSGAVAASPGGRGGLGGGGGGGGAAGSSAQGVNGGDGGLAGVGGGGGGGGGYFSGSVVGQGGIGGAEPGLGYDGDAGNTYTGGEGGFARDSTNGGAVFTGSNGLPTGGGGGGGFGGATGGKGGDATTPGEAGYPGNTSIHTIPDLAHPDPVPDAATVAAIRTYLNTTIGLNNIYSTFAGDNWAAFGTGADTIDGGPGSDHLFGMGGNDTFVFDRNDAGSADVDVVWDFKKNADADKLLFKIAGVQAFQSVAQSLVDNAVRGNWTDATDSWVNSGSGADLRLTFTDGASHSVSVVLIGQTSVALSDFTYTANNKPAIGGIVVPSLAFAEGDAATAVSTAITVTDADAEDITDASISITGNYQSAEDTLAFVNQNGITGTWNAGTGVMTLTGATSVANYQTALRSITYNNVSEAPSPAARTVSFSVTDFKGEASSVVTAQITVAAVNDAPTASNLSAAEAFIEDAGAFSLTDIVVADVDSPTVTATLTLSNIAAGSLSTATSGAVTSTFSSGVWTASGAVANVNVLLAGVTFTPAANFAQNFNIATSVDDAVAAAITGTKVVTVTAVNDNPLMSGLPTAITVIEDTASNVNLSAAALSDVDAASGSITFTIAAAAGTLSAASGGGVTVGGSGSGTLTLSGTVANIDTYLNTASSIQYTGAANAQGTNTTTLTLTANDGGNTGTGGGGNVALGTVNVDITAVADTPSVTNASTNEDTQTVSGLVISRNASDGAEVTHFGISSITGGTLYQNDGTTLISNGAYITFAQANAGLKFTPTANSFSSGSFVVHASTSNAGDGLSAGSATATITVTPIADTPSVTNASTNEDTQTASGLVISRNANDGAEVTHFRITSITGGTLYQNNGTTVITEGSYITFAQASAGLKFTPTSNSFSNGSFVVHAATSNVGAGLSASGATATITVTAIADTPSVTSASTNEDTQTVSGLVISRNASDGAEVTHFRITSISGGTLYQNDGTTVISNGAYITFAQANAGLKFTPTSNSISSGSFVVHAATSNVGAGLSVSGATATITVSAIADTPSVTSASTNEDTQTASGLVINRNVNDGAEVTDFRISGITGGALYQNNGTTVITEGSYITFAQANAGLKFTPTANSFSNGSFVVHAATSNVGAGLSVSGATATITVTPIADTPSVTNASTSEDTQTASGLVISRNASDGAEVTHFRITSITGGTLYQNDGTTVISNGAYISFAQANAGLKFTPASNSISSGSFVVHAATSNAGAGLSAGSATATITVTPIADTPSVTNASTNEDTQTTSGLVISRNASDGAEVTHFRISSITGGTLYQNNGTTVITEGSYITFAQASAGLKFTPALNSTSNGSFVVHAATSNAGAGLSASSATATIALTAVNDLPTGSVTITGTAFENQVLVADTSSIADVDGLGTFNYQWKRGVTNIGSNSSSYRLLIPDIGSSLTVTVSYTDADGTLETLTSAATAVVAGADSDNDGISDSLDAFPYDSTETVDMDSDGVGDNADTDRDGDGVANRHDAFPDDPTEWSDLDADGVGDNTDSVMDDTDADGILNPQDHDIDGDGVPNSVDAFPYDSTESSDLDGDGIGDNADTDRDGDGIANGADTYPNDTDNDGIPNVDDTDMDGDGVLNKNDAFPLDSTESRDTDGDGTGDNADTDRDADGIDNSVDTYPNDTDNDGISNDADPDDDGDGIADSIDDFTLNPDEWLDTDEDGLGDNADLDRDGDGIANSSDVYPDDFDNDGIADLSDTDRDGDGIANDQDALPLNPAETKDTDSDGIGDNMDSDRDGDGVLNTADTYPDDTDNDGVDNEQDSDRDNDGVPNVRDAFPLDETENSDIDADGIGDNADTDVDGDDISNATEGTTADTDADGIPDYRDPVSGLHGGDSDNDGIPDAGECPHYPDCADSDGDSIPDYMDADNAIIDANAAPVIVVRPGLGSMSAGWLFIVGAGLLGLRQKKTQTVLAILLSVLGLSLSAQAETKTETVTNVVTANETVIVTDTVVAKNLDKPGAYYWGIKLGVASFDPDTSGTIFDVTEKQSSAVGVLAGLRLRPDLMLEASFASLGESKFSTLGNPVGSIEYQVINVSGVYKFLDLKTWPVGLYVQGGLAHLNIKANIPVNAEKSTSLSAGLIADYAWADNMKLRLAVESYSQDIAYSSLSLVWDIW